MHERISGVLGGLVIGIVADVRLYRETLSAALGNRPGLLVAWTAGELDEAIALSASEACSAVVIDMATRDSLRIVRSMRNASPSLPIVAFAAQEIDQDIIDCAEAGVAGYVPAEATVDDLVTAISSAVRGEVTCSPRAAAVVFKRIASSASRSSVETPILLTTRERGILDLIERGLSNKEIAARLNIQVATVKNHVHNLLEKLHVSTRNEAAARHRTAGLARSIDA
jgi:two-component system nitrate/nitrite response regulator NarL